MSNKMGDTATLMKARQELEDLYLGVPDDSVDLTFKDFASFQQNDVAERKTSNMEPIREETEDVKARGGLGKSPSLDFAKGLEGNREMRHKMENEVYREQWIRNSAKRNKGLKVMVDNSQIYDDVSAFSIASPCEERGGRRRPGIPHSNICAVCSEYIYIFRHRCLVCGRVYCRQCVGIGMGEMTEGRKCVECLGRRFSQRYIQRAGKVGCCSRYPSNVKQQELIWAEKGPRRSGERGYGRSGMVSRSISPVMPGTPTRPKVSRSRSPVMPGTPTRPKVSRSRSPVMPGTPSRSQMSGSRSPVMRGTPNRSHVSNSQASFVMSSPLSTSPHAFPL